jgi:hypothetical protein
VLAEGDTNVRLEDTGPNNGSANRPGVAVSSVKAVMSSESRVSKNTRGVWLQNIVKYSQRVTQTYVLEDTGPKNGSANRPGLAVSSVKAELLSESVRGGTRIRSYVGLTTSQINQEVIRQLTTPQINQGVICSERQYQSSP